MTRSISNYDVVIVGAGPAGLFFAKELGKDFKVLVLERNAGFDAKKFWVSWRENVVRHDLRDCVISVAPVGHFRFGNEIDVKFKDAFCWILNPQKVISKWRKEISKKVDLMFNTNFIKCRKSLKSIKVFTSRGNFEAKLLIDAAGHSSKLATRGRNAVERLICSNYAAEVEGLDLGKEATVLGILYPRRPAVFYEYFPLRNNFSVLEVCTYSKKPISLASLKRDFDLHLALLRNSMRKPSRVRIAKKLGGYLPLNKLKSRAFDRILLVGDAGAWPPRLSGGGFNAILTHGKTVVEKLKRLIRTDQLDKSHLNKVFVFSPIEEKNREIQDILTYYIFRSSFGQLKRLFKVLQKLPSGIVPDFIRLKMTDKQVAQTMMALGKEFSLLEFIRVIPLGLRFSTLRGFWLLLQSFLRGRK